MFGTDPETFIVMNPTTTDAVVTGSTEIADKKPATDAYVSITIVITIIGLVGNVLCIVVMLNKAMRHLPFAVFSGVLAVSDSFILIESAILTSISRIPIVTSFERNTCGFFQFISYFCNQFSAWIVVYLTLERMIAVLLPLKCREIVTRRRASVILLMTGCILLAINIHAFWTAEYSYSHYTCDWKKAFKQSILYRVYLWVDVTLFFLVPATSIIMLNSIMIWHLFYMKKYHQTSVRKQKNAIYLLFTVSITFVALTAPVTIHDMYFLYIGKQSDEDGAFYVVTYSLWLLNYAVNFYLYSLAGTKVRTILIQFCYKPRTATTAAASGMPKITQTRL